MHNSTNTHFLHMCHVSLTQRYTCAHLPSDIWLCVCAGIGLYTIHSNPCSDKLLATDKLLCWSVIIFHWNWHIDSPSFSRKWPSCWLLISSGYQAAATGVTGSVGGQPLNKLSGLLSTSYANENGNWQPWLAFMGWAPIDGISARVALLFLHCRPGAICAQRCLCCGGSFLKAFGGKCVAAARAWYSGKALQSVTDNRVGPKIHEWQDLPTWASGVNFLGHSYFLLLTCRQLSKSLPTLQRCDSTWGTDSTGCALSCVQLAGERRVSCFNISIVNHKIPLN